MGAPAFEERPLFKTLFAAYPDGLLLVDASGAIVLANPAACELLGYPDDALLGLPVDALVPDSIRPRHAAYREAYGEKPRARPMGTQMDLVALRRDGSEVMVEIALSPLQEHGLPYVVAAVRAIGSYPRVKQALQRARYAEHVSQFGRMAVDVRDPRLLVEAVPRLAAQALEAPAAYVLLHADEPGPPRVAAGIGLPAPLRTGQPLPEDCERIWREAGLAGALSAPLTDRGRRTGEICLRFRGEPRNGEDEQHFLESLSSLLATSLQRAHSEAQLLHSQRLESVGQLTGGIAHDFNNLLTVISGNLQVLEELDLPSQDESSRQLVGAALRAARRGAELTGKLLAFSRRQVLQPQAVDTRALLAAMADMLRRTLDQRIRIEVHADDDCPRCVADPTQLESALLNIAINARDAMPDGGTLAFHGTRAESGQELLGEPGGPSELVALSVRDSGSGMPEAVKARAFEPFFTTKESGRGTGLGLATVYGFAKQSRGAVTLESAPGLGTTVTLYLPAAPDHVAPGDDDARVPTHLPRGLAVLLVEDDAAVRAVVQRFLDTLGCVVTWCASGEEPAAQLRGGQRFDLLLTDVALGAGMRGTELARIAQQLTAPLPVLLMSGFASGLIEAPPDLELLRKPFERSELEQAMTRLLAAAR